MIPERIHQYWHSEDIPAPVGSSRQILSDRNPGYAATLWSRRSAGEYLQRYFGPAIAGLFQCCAIPAMQSDFFRYCVLLKEGGIYLDSDAVANVPFSSWLEPTAAIVLPMTNIKDRERPGLGNGFIACAAGSAILGFALGQCLFNVSRRSGNNIARVTGPRTLHCALRFGSSDRVQLVDPRDCYIANFELGERGDPRHWSRRQQSESIFSGSLAGGAAFGIQSLLAQISTDGHSLTPRALAAVETGWLYAEFEGVLRDGGDAQAAAAALSAPCPDFDFSGLVTASYGELDADIKHWRREYVRRNLRRFDDALKELVTVLASGDSPEDRPVYRSPGLWQQAALALESAGERVQALEAVERALDAVEYERGIWLAANRLFSAAGRYQEVQRLAAEVLQRDPGNVAALHYLARACEEGGELDRARATAEKWVNAANSENAWAQLARIQFKQQQFEHARETLARAREVFPRSRKFERLAAQIEQH